MGVYLGLDLGSSAVKALLLDSRRGVLATERVPYPSHTPHPGWIEQDPADWWRAALKAAAGLRGRPEYRRVAAVGLSGHMSSTVLLDREGRLLRPCIHINDSRAAPEAAELAGRLGPRIRRRTGNPVHVAFVLPRLLWLQRHEPQTWERLHTLLSAKDYLCYRLTDERGTDPTDAGNTLLWDYRRQAWATELLEALGLGADWLPPVRGSLEVAGRLRGAAARALGLPAGLPVVAGLADMAASSLGAGLSAGTVVITIGNSAQVVRLEDGVRYRPGLTLHPYLGGRYYAMASIFSGGMALDWAVRTLGADAALLEAAARVPLGAGGVRFVPHLVGSGTPWLDPHERGAWVGLGAGSGRAELLRAVFEGVAWDIAQGFRALTEGQAEGVVLGGAAARNPLWARLLAGFLGRPVAALAEPNTSALGAAYAAALACEPGLESPRLRARRPVPPGGESFELLAAQYAGVHAGLVRSRRR